MSYERMWIGLLLACFLTTKASWADERVPPDSLREKRSSLVVLPYAYYTPETKFAFGVGSIYSFRPAEGPAEQRPSNVRLALTYTQRKQIILAFLPEVYFGNETYYLNGYYGFYRYPDKYWGTGGDTPDDAEERYEPLRFKADINMQRRIMRGLYIGLRYQFEYIELLETAGDGVLRYGTIPGSEGGYASGLGLIINHDTRNHTYRPSAGFYNQFYVISFGSAIGSDYTFNLLSIDLRTYFSVFNSHVLAFQTYNGFITGRPPFQMLNMLGGSYWMRGYYSGRYRDRHMITCQAEYRFPLVWRFGAVAFAGFGDVGEDVTKFKLDRFKYSVGFGVRFLFDRQEGINARLDIGFGKGGNSGIYAMVVEAF